MGLETGDLEFSAYSIHIYSAYSYFAGMPLAALEQEFARNSYAIVRIKQEAILNWHNMFWQVVLNLMGRSKYPYRLTGDEYDENIMLPFHQVANDRLAIHYLYLNKSILYFLFQEYTQALEYSKKAEQHIDGAASMLPVAVFHFYDSLIRLALYPDMSQTEQDRFLTKVSGNQEKMKQWAYHSPMNFRHKFYLVEAERSRVLGKDGDARELYDKAIEFSHEHGYLNEEALAHELAAYGASLYNYLLFI